MLLVLMLLPVLNLWSGIKNLTSFCDLDKFDSITSNDSSFSSIVLTLSIICVSLLRSLSDVSVSVEFEFFSDASMGIKGVNTICELEFDELDNVLCCALILELLLFERLFSDEFTPIEVNDDEDETLKLYANCILPAAAAQNIVNSCVIKSMTSLTLILLIMQDILFSINIDDELDS